MSNGLQQERVNKGYARIRAAFSSRFPTADFPVINAALEKVLEKNRGVFEKDAAALRMEVKLFESKYRGRKEAKS